MSEQEKALQLRLQKAKQEFAQAVRHAIEDFNLSTSLHVVNISVAYIPETSDYPLLQCTFK